MCPTCCHAPLVAATLARPKGVQTRMYASIHSKNPFPWCSVCRRRHETVRLHGKEYLCERCCSKRQLQATAPAKTTAPADPSKSSKATAPAKTTDAKATDPARSSAKSSAKASTATAAQSSGISSGYTDVRLIDKQEDIESLSTWEKIDGQQNDGDSEAGYELIKPPIKGASLLL